MYGEGDGVKIPMKTKAKMYDDLLLYVKNQGLEISGTIKFADNMSMILHSNSLSYYEALGMAYHQIASIQRKLEEQSDTRTRGEF